MNDKGSPTVFGQKVSVWLLGLIAAAILCSPYVLMPLARKAVQAKAPSQAQAWKNDGPFAVIGVEYPFNLDEASYAARVQTTATHRIPYDGFLKENRSIRLASNELLIYLYLGLLQRVTGNIHATWLLTRFIFAALWFVLIYLIIHRMTRARELSVFAACAVTFFSYLLILGFLQHLPSHPFSLERLARTLWVLSSYGRTDGVLRIPRPAISYAAAFAVTYGVLRALSSGRQRHLWLAGVAVGLLAYVRLVVWSSHMGALFIFAVIHCVREKSLRHRLWIPLLAAGIVSLPWMLINVPADPEMLRRVATFSRLPNLFSLLYLAAFLVGLRKCRRGGNTTLLWLTAFQASLFLLCNMQVVTGYSISIGHWQWFGNIYTLLLGLGLLNTAWRKKTRLWNGLSLFLVLWACSQSAVYSFVHYHDHAYPRTFAEGIRWLNANARPDDVVAVLDPLTNSAVPALTRCKVLVANPALTWSDVSLRENAQRLLYALRRFGIDLDDFIDLKTFKLRLEGDPSRYSLDHYFGILSREPRLPAFLSETPPPEGAFQADFVWFGPFEKRFARRSELRAADLSEVFRNERVTIYRIEQ